MLDVVLMAELLPSSLSHAQLLQHHRGADAATIQAWAQLPGDEIRAIPHTLELYQSHVHMATKATYHLMEACGMADLVISSGQLHHYFCDDQTKPFRSSPYFAHLCPLAGPYHLIHLSVHHPPLLVIYHPTDFWHKTPPHSSHPLWAAISNCYTTQVVGDKDKLLAPVQPRISPSGRHVLIADMPGPPQNFELNPGDSLLGLGLIRTRKTPWEVACTLAANHLGMRAHHALQAAFGADTTISERELYYVFQQAAELIPEDYPYAPIIALDEHAAFLHYNLREPATPGASSIQVLVDAGATCCGYASDITRTTLRPASAAMRTWQGRLISTATHQLYAHLLAELDKLRQNLCAQATAGSCQQELGRECQLRIAALLHQAELITTLPHAAEDKIRLAKLFFPHGLGHMLGTLTHDFNPYKKPQCSPADEANPPTAPLHPGHLFTIEPGIYFIPSLLQAAAAELQSSLNSALIAELTPLGGMRIEDNMYISTEGQPVNLTRLAAAGISNPAVAPA